jgi:hypothetical protein
VKETDIVLAEPWGDILADGDSGVRAIATATYDGKPIDVDARVIEAIDGRNGDGQA